MLNPCGNNVYERHRCSPLTGESTASTCSFAGHVRTLNTTVFTQATPSLKAGSRGDSIRIGTNPDCGTLSAVNRSLTLHAEATGANCISSRIETPSGAEIRVTTESNYSLVSVYTLT